MAYALILVHKSNGFFLNILHSFLNEIKINNFSSENSPVPYTYVLLLLFTLSTTWYFILFLRFSKGALSRPKMYDISTYLHVDPKTD